MEIAVIDHENRFNQKFVSYIQKKFSGVNVHSFQSIDDLLDHKQVYDYVYMNQSVCKRCENVRAYTKYMKHIVCVSYFGEQVSVSSSSNVDVVSEDEIQEWTLAKIRSYVKEEKNHSLIMASRNKIQGILGTLLIVSYFFSVMDRSGYFLKIVPVVICLIATLLDIFYFDKKETGTISIKRILIESLLFIGLILLVFWEEIMHHVM